MFGAARASFGDLSSCDDDGVPHRWMKKSECAGEGNLGAALRSLKTLQGFLEIDGLSSRMLEYLASNELSQLQGTCKLGHLRVFGYAVRTKLFLWSTIQGWEEQKRASVRRLLIDTYSPLSENVLPASITQLTFGFYFNQPLSEHVLPASITQLTFGSDFNQPLSEHVLPASITQLTFGSEFNQPLSEHVLPASITQLTFGRKFNQPLIVGVLPANLTKLSFGCASFEQVLNEDVLIVFADALEAGKT
jgi:hypothetical protein